MFQIPVLARHFHLGIVVGGSGNGVPSLRSDQDRHRMPHKYYVKGVLMAYGSADTGSSLAEAIRLRATVGE
jgi:hypothetical protein